MKKIILFTLMCLTITFSYSGSKIGINEQEEITLIKLNTNKGDIIIKLFTKDAPETSNNFINYVKNGSYNGTIFHRVIKNFMIQGGGHLPDMSEISTNPPIVNESNNSISNKKGTIAMARTSDPHSATSQFFINLKDNDFLDMKNSPDGYGYCVFGEIIEGIEIVEDIGTVGTGNKAGHADVPLDDIVLENAEFIDN